MSSNVISLKTKKYIQIENQVENKTLEEKVVKKVKKAKRVVNPLYKLLNNSIKVVSILTMIVGITSYLVYQNYEFFNAIIKSNQLLVLCGAAISVPALLNSVVAELILLTAAAFTSSKKLFTKVLAWVLLVSMICGLGVFMHSSIHNDLTGNSDYVQSLKQQKKDAVAAKESYEVEKNALDPLTWKTRREALQVKINVERENIVSLDTKISEAKEVSSGNLQGIILYNTILRIAAMLVNALLAHALVSRFSKQ